MYSFLVVLVLATIVITIAKTLARRSAATRAFGAMVNQSAIAALDAPQPFGSKMSWLAVRTHDTAALIDVLNLSSAKPVNWADGIGAIYDGRGNDACMFVTPPVGEWTLVAGLALPHPLGPVFKDNCTPLLQALSARFGEAHYYFSFPLLDFYAWAKAENGEMVRAFATGDEGVIWNRGRLTREERSLSLRHFELRGVDNRSGDIGGDMLLLPTEQQVLRLAGKWSFDPSTLDRVHEKKQAGAMPVSHARGYLGAAPRSWRSERLQKSAA